VLPRQVREFYGNLEV
jgi:hypothetical protein